MENIIDVLEKKLKNTDDSNPIKIAYSENLRYYSDFIKVLNTFNQYLSKKQIEDLLNNKLLLEKPYNQSHYLQAISEINILYYVLRKFNNEFKYEPKYNGNKNPECSFKCIDYVINLEVKCPDLTSKIECEKRSTNKVHIPERIKPNTMKIIEDNFKKNNGNFEIEKRDDNKLKDYLISSAGKFPKCQDDNFNILVVSLDIISDLDEWYGYIFGNGGVFTSESFVNREDYKNVDAILLTTSMGIHTAFKDTEDVNRWELENCFNLLFLDTHKQDLKKEDFYNKYAINIFGKFTKFFILYKNEFINQSKSDSIKDYIINKNNSLKIISKFVDYIESL